VTSPLAAQNSLETRLKELERLGLARPASVLITEYLAALTAESIVDAETAERVASAYHRSRYDVVDSGDLEVREAETRLEKVAATLAAMSDDARRQLADRVLSRLTPMTADTSQPPAVVAAQTSAMQTGLEPRSTRIGAELAIRPAQDLASFPEMDPVSDSKLRTATGNRGMRIRSLSLETAALLVLALIFAGYFFRHGVDRAIDGNKAERSASGRNHVGAADIWRRDDFWAANLRKRAQADAAKKRDESARLTYELLLLSAPNDPGALNDLAWLYLTSEEAAVRDSKRGLELALRALAISRTPAILDTAAEAHFQAGHAAEAVKLEQEALHAIPGFPGSDYTQFRTLLTRQLQKFQSAEKSSPSAMPHSPSS
jgi:hypothetical protein